MKFLVIGLGSMGKRRIRNLLALEILSSNIIGFDLRADRRQEAEEKYQIGTIKSLTAQVLEQVNALVISTPPDQHADYAIMGLQAKKPVFIEASVLDDNHAEIVRLAEQHKRVVFPSCTMKFYPGPKRLKALLSQGIIGQVYAWQYQSGQYLPDWHPWESILDYYVSRKETGGCREIVPFELVWLCDLFGKVRDIQSHLAKVSDLPTDIDDIYTLNIQHRSGVVGQLMVDVLSRVPMRSIRITGSLGTIEWDDTRKLIRYYTIESKQWVEEWLEQGEIEANYINPEGPYIEEMAAYLECIQQQKQPAFTICADQEILALLYRAEETSFDVCE